jgi:cation:H+ antiporter
MEEWLAEIVVALSWPLLAGLIALCLALLAKGAGWLVDEAVTLSKRSGIPKIIIGATVVSLGTTAPEAVVSVLAAIQGKPGLALGNAVGSIICDTGLILGVACLISPLPLDRKIVNRQGWIQFGSGILLVLVCLPWGRLGSVFVDGGRMPRWVGFLFLILLVGYLIKSVHWARTQNLPSTEVPSVAEPQEEAVETSVPLVLVKLVGAVGLVVGSSWVLIPAVSEAAMRLQVPESIIAATLVAFGTSLPELVTAVTAAYQGHGELAVGNVVGADILNVLFVAGAAAAVTQGGLQAPSHFFSLYFPSMLLVLVVFRVGIWLSGDRLKRPFGAVLLGTYIVVSVLSYAGQ